MNNTTPGRVWTKKKIIAGCLFIGMALLAIGGGYYQKSLREWTSFKINLPQTEAQTVMIDLGDMGLPKYLVQPGRIRISAGRNGVRNISNDVLRVRVRANGFPGSVAIKSSSHEVDMDAGNYLVIEPGKTAALALELDIDRTQVYSHELGEATLEFVDDASRQVLGQVTFTFRNQRLSGLK